MFVFTAVFNACVLFSMMFYFSNRRIGIVFKVLLTVTFIINLFFWSFIKFVVKMSIVQITVDIIDNIRITRIIPIIGIVVSIIRDLYIRVVYRVNAIATEMILLLR